MGTKTHTRETFCKYTTASTAKKVLQTKQVRWSSPLLFNDPFDCGHTFEYGFKLSDAKDFIVEESLKIIYSEEVVPGNVDHPLYLMLMELRKIRERLSREELITEFTLGFEEAASNAVRFLSGFSQQWQVFMREHRVLCLTESHDDILMWSHYADYHKGAVIQLKCIDELDNVVCAATKVVYSDYFPSICSTPEDFAKEYTGQKKTELSDLYRRFICTKSVHWAYEKEWRLVYPRKVSGAELFEMGNLWPQEIDAIYLGCRMQEADKAQILELLNDELSHVRVFQGTKDKFRYALNFEQIK